MGVLDHYNGIIHHDPQTEEQGKEYDEVEGDSRAGQEFRTGQEQEGQEHTQRYGQSHKEGVGDTHKEHEDQHYQDEADDNGVHQLVESRTGLDALVAGNGDVQILGELVAPELIYDLVDLLGSYDEVLSRPLDDAKGHHVLSIQPSIAFLLADGVCDHRDVAQIDDVAGDIFYNDLFQVEGGFELTVHPQCTLLIADREQSTGDVCILALDGRFDVGVAYLGRLHFEFIDIDLDLTFGCTHQIYSVDLGKFFKTILECLGKFSQFHRVIITTHVYRHDREFPQADLLHHRFLREVVRKVLPGLVHRVLDLLEGDIGLHRSAELDHHSGEILQGGTRYLIDLHTGDSTKLLLDRARHQVFHILRRVADIDGLHVDRGDDDIRELLLGQVHEEADAPDGDKKRDEINGGLVPDRPIGGEKGFTLFQLFGVEPGMLLTGHASMFLKFLSEDRLSC